MDVSQPTAEYDRFCPGEESIRISNAICRGRRRSHFPSCHGCEFNDDEKGPGPSAATIEKPDDGSQIDAIFQHQEIFATVPTPLSSDIAWRMGHAIAQYLRAKLRGYDRANRNASSLVVGRDMRTHSPMLQRSLVEGARAAGLDVIDIGIVDTPQLYFAVNQTGACGGIQTTAGTRPAQYNGFIICGAKASPFTADTGLASIRDLAARVPKHQTGTTSRLTEQDFSKPYADFVRDALGGDGRLRRPLKVVADASNGMAGKWLPIIFQDVKRLTIVPLNYQRRGKFQHDPDPTQIKNTKDLRMLVKKRKADLGVCFSGDAAQCSFADEKGTLIPADMITALLAKRFAEREPGVSILLDLRFSRAAAEEITRAGGHPALARVGPTFIKKAMAEKKAVLGGDLTGRFYFRDNFFCESATLALVHVLNLMADTGRKLSELIRPLQHYRSSGERRFPCPDPDRALTEITNAHRDAEIDNLDGITVKYPDWWFNVRPSRTEALLRVTLEARTRKLVDEKLTELRPLLSLRT
ncbi:MAG: phosphomannomutase/phosphoglucomutase [Dehalococcoidia bacterium]